MYIAGEETQEVNASSENIENIVEFSLIIIKKVTFFPIFVSVKNNYIYSIRSMNLFDFNSFSTKFRHHSF